MNNFFDEGFCVPWNQIGIQYEDGQSSLHTMSASEYETRLAEYNLQLIPAFRRRQAGLFLRVWITGISMTKCSRPAAREAVVFNSLSLVLSSPIKRKSTGSFKCLISLTQRCFLT